MPYAYLFVVALQVLEIHCNCTYSLIFMDEKKALPGSFLSSTGLRLPLGLFENLGKLLSTNIIYSHIIGLPLLQNAGKLGGVPVLFAST